MFIKQDENLLNHKIFCPLDIHDMPGYRIYSEWILADFYCLLRDGAFLARYEEKAKIQACFEFIVGLYFSCFHWHGDQFISTTHDRWVYDGAGELGVDSLWSGFACQSAFQAPNVIGKISPAIFVNHGWCKFISVICGRLYKLAIFVRICGDISFVSNRMSYGGHSLFLEIDSSILVGARYYRYFSLGMSLCAESRPDKKQLLNPMTLMRLSA